MKPPFRRTSCTALLSVSLSLSCAMSGRTEPGTPAKPPAAAPAPKAAKRDGGVQNPAPQAATVGDRAPGAEMTPRGRNVRGFYVPYPKVLKAKPEAFARWVVESGASAVVIDVKDDHGRVTFTREIPYATGKKHGCVEQMGDIVRALHGAGVYVIGRLVSMKDTSLSMARPEVAVRHRKTNAPWRDRHDLVWVDPHAELVRKHIAAVARAAEAVGFDEIQLDYIRFPVEPEARYAVFPAREGSPSRHEAIAAVLAEVDAAIRIPLSIDVFGLTAYHPGDADGLGQSLEHLAPYVDAITPMVYLANWPQRYWEFPDHGTTNKLVEGAVREIRRRLGDGIVVRPLLQAFPWRAKLFSKEFISGQIRASERGGASGYLFWNQAGSYGIVKTVWRSLDASATAGDDDGAVAQKRN